MNAWLRNLGLVRRSGLLMMLAMLALLTVGVMFIYSSCFISTDQPVRELYRKQMVWIMAGAVGYMTFLLVDYRKLGKVAWWGYAGSLVLLVLVLFIGDVVSGAQRRIDFAGLTVQPSELAKISTIILLAWLMSRPAVDSSRLAWLGIALGIMVVPILLILQQPDLGTAIVFVPTVFVMLFVAGLPWRWVLGIVVIGVTLVALVVSAAMLPLQMGLSEERQLEIWSYTQLNPYQRDRIVTFFDADKDPLNRGWNKRQSLIAVGSGGISGKGFLCGDQNILGFLPRSVAPTDFIYSVIAEETGFVGSVTVLLLFGILIVGGSVTAYLARDRFGCLLCSGIVTLIFCHVLVNVAMTVGLMPITGLPLPLLSYGGSFTIVMMSALGIVQSVHIRSRQPSRNSF